MTQAPFGRYHELLLADRRCQSAGFTPKLGSAGFTLVEMIMIMLVLVMMAAFIMPHIAAYEQTQAEKTLEGEIASLPAEVVNDAVKLQVPVALTVQGNQLVIEETPPEGMQMVNSSQPQSTQGIQVLKQLDLGNDLQVTGVQTGGQSADLGTWMWTVYPDGSASDAGIEFMEGRLTKSLVLQADGRSRWVEGALPDQSPTEWTAGQLEQTQSTTTQP